LLQLRGKLLHVVQLSLAMRLGGHGEDTIIAQLLALGLLLRLQDTNELATHHQARIGLSIVNDHHIKRIAVLRIGRRDEPKIVRVGEPQRQRFLQYEGFELRVEIKLCLRSARRFDDRVDHLRSGPGWQLGEIRHSDDARGGDRSATTGRPPPKQSGTAP
jgi:hypothetical protein